MSCQFYDDCQNNSRCFVCNDLRLLKLASDKKRQSIQSKARVISKKKDNLEDSSESWKDLESLVAARISAVPTKKQYLELKEARRQVRSGAIWFMPGDVADTVILAECKERSTVTAKGEKSITIPKSWLTKLKKESEIAGQYPTFVFRYKNDDTAYVLNDFDVLCDMVTEIKFLRIDNAEKDIKIEKLMNVIREQEQEIIELNKQEW